MLINNPLTLTPWASYLQAFDDLETEMKKKSAEGDGRTVLCETWRHLLKECITRQAAHSRFHEWEVKHLPRDARIVETTSAIFLMLEKGNKNLKLFVVSDHSFLPCARRQEFTAPRYRIRKLSYSRITL